MQTIPRRDYYSLKSKNDVKEDIIATHYWGEYLLEETVSLKLKAMNNQEIVVRIPLEKQTQLLEQAARVIKLRKPVGMVCATTCCHH